MLDLRFRPLDKWKESRPLGHARSPFKMAYAKTLDLLEFELRKLNAQDILIEAGFKLADIRNDGYPRGGTSTAHPGVVLYFVAAGETLRFPCGTYATWQANLHAIALTLERLRDIDRYGVTVGHQQYIGFKALPPAKQSSFRTIEEAAQFLESQQNLHGASAIIGSQLAYRAAYRDAAAKLHPDARGGGNREMFELLNQATVLLDIHHGRGKNEGAG